MTTLRRLASLLERARAGIRLGGLAMTLAASPLDAQGQRDAVKLHPRINVGEQFFFVEESRQQIDIRIPNAPQTQSLKIARTFMVEVLEVSQDGAMQLALIIVRVHGEVGERTGDPRAFDTLDESTLDEPSQLAALGSAVLSRIGEANRKLTVRTNARGRVTSDIMLAGTSSERAALTPEQQSRLKQLIESVFGRSPTRAVTLGEKWQHEQRSSGTRLPTIQRAEVTLVKVDASGAELRIDGVIQTDQDAAAPQTIQVDGTVAGTQRLSRNGVVQETTLRAEAALQLPGMVETPARLRLDSSLRRATAAELRAVRRRMQASATSAAEAARIAEATRVVAALTAAVRAFYVQNARLPASLEALAKDERLQVPEDPWGRPYALVVGAVPGEFAVRSDGPDRQPNTDDDITSAPN